MRSGTNCIINSGQVHSWSLGLLLDAKLVKDHGWKCSAAIVLGIALRAAARCISDQRRLPRLGQSAVRSGRDDGLGRRLAQNAARLGTAVERRPDRPAASSACAVGRGTLPSTGTCSPTTGSRSKAATNFTTANPNWEPTKFHAYASACIVEYGQRYTLVLTWVRRHESMVRVLRRMAARIREIGLKIRRLLLDRAFFNGAVVAFLQEEKLPFVMPVVIRGRAPKKGTKPTGLRWIKRQPAGWYPHRDETREATVADFGMRGLSPTSQPQGRQAAASEVVVRSVACTWFSHRNPRTVPSAIRHRNQFPPNAAGTHLHLHAQSSAAAVLSGRGADSAEPVGVDSSHSPCRRIGRHADTAPGIVAIQAHARLDRPRNRRPISRRLNTLRHSAAVNQTWKLLNDNGNHVNDT